MAVSSWSSMFRCEMPENSRQDVSWPQDIESVLTQELSTLFTLAQQTY